MADNSKIEWTPDHTLEVWEAIKPVEWTQETGARCEMRLIHEDAWHAAIGWTIESRTAHPGYEAESRDDGWHYWHAPTLHEVVAIVFYAAVWWLVERKWTVSLRGGDAFSAILSAIGHTREMEAMNARNQ